jgi:hypothetical protein
VRGPFITNGKKCVTFIVKSRSIYNKHCDLKRASLWHVFFSQVELWAVCLRQELPSSVAPLIQPAPSVNNHVTSAKLWHWFHGTEWFPTCGPREGYFKGCANSHSFAACFAPPDVAWFPPLLFLYWTNCEFIYSDTEFVIASFHWVIPQLTEPGCKTISVWESYEAVLTVERLGALF